jgi:hypothetical protein
MTPLAKAWRLDAREAADVNEEMTGLAELVGGMTSDRRAVGERAAALAGRLDRWADAVARAQPTPDELAALSRDLADIHLAGRLGTWSEAALAYDALASLHQSQLSAARSARRSEAPLEPTKTAIGELYRELSKSTSDRDYVYSPQKSAKLLERVRGSLDDEEARP